MRKARQAIALLALAGLLAPGAGAALVTLHVALHHAAHPHEHSHLPTHLSTVWHGHSHDSTAPDHDHPWLVEAVLTSRAQKIAHDLPQGPAFPPDSFEIGRMPLTARSRAPGSTGAGPPLCPERPSILRI